MALDGLPNEILEHILQYCDISVRDVCNFGTTCSKFRLLVNNSNKLWKVKFRQQWPELQYSLTKEYLNWKNEYITRLDFSRKMKQLISNMSSKFYRRDEVSNSEMTEFSDLMAEHNEGYAFIVSDLLAILNDGDENSNLTHKFYAEKAIRYIKQTHLTNKWYHFISLPPEEQLLEKAAVMVAQWCQPQEDLRYSRIASQFDEIAENVKQLLWETNSSHPLFTTSAETLQHWRSCNIPDNQWKPIDSQQILNCLREILFIQMGFHGNNSMYYSAENSFIDKVLEYRRGIPITLSILYESIARRLGIRCEPVSFPAHFLLRWRDQYNTENSLQPSQHYYIDVFNGGEFLTKRNCPRFSPNIPCPMRGKMFPAATTPQVVERMANNLEVAGRQRAQQASGGRRSRLRSTLELLNLVNPLDLTCVLHLARYYMLYDMDLCPLMDSIIRMQNELDDRPRDQAKHIMQMLQVYETHRKYNHSENEIEPKPRTPSVEFAVGMIMKHRQYNYRCVIYGYDPRCLETKEWISQMGVDNLSMKADQPFYHVLADDGSFRYAAQENLEISSQTHFVDHTEIGRYFDKFCSTYYQPNAEKEKEYPQDGAVRNNFVTLMRSNTESLLGK